jgi:23S rRNA pseudouridine1911/1915/1917 synthase
MSFAEACIRATKRQRYTAGCSGNESIRAFKGNMRKYKNHSEPNSRRNNSGRNRFKPNKRKPGSDGIRKQTEKSIRSRFGDIKVLFEDQHIIIVDKPAGLLTIATGKNEYETLYRLVNQYLALKKRRERMFVVHRLDRDTSGIVLFAKSYKEKLTLQDSWQTIVDNKIYTAIVEGRVTDKTKEIRSYLAENRAFKVYSTEDTSIGKEAITSFECVTSGKAYSMLRIRLATGRKNQIRVHMSDYGHPVAGDKKYGGATNPLRRLCLHATELEFAHPVTGEKIKVVSPPPPGFIRLVGERE